MMLNSKPPEEGTYEVLMSPTVAANLISLVGGFASAFSVDAGTSYLVGQDGEEGRVGVVQPDGPRQDQGGARTADLRRRRVHRPSRRR